MTTNTQTQPFVSFVIPCYNLPQQLLVECLDSIFALPLEESQREVIVVDDGSDQCQLDGLNNYRDQIIYLRQANQGLSGARNTGLNICRGQYVQFVDGDDMLLTEAYAHCIDILQNEKQIDMVIFEATDSPVAVNGFTDDQPESGAEYMRHHNLHGSACGYVFRRAMAGQLRFTRGILHEDE